MTHSPAIPGRQPSPAECAMAAHASSRDLQGRRQDRAARELHVGMMGDGAEEQNLGQIGDPSARAPREDAQAAFADRAPRDRPGAPDDMPDR